MGFSIRSNRHFGGCEIHSTIDILYPLIDYKISQNGNVNSVLNN